MLPDDLARAPPADLRRRKLPVVRQRCDHFTTFEDETEGATATCRTLSPTAKRAIARSRKSIDIARIIPKALDCRAKDSESAHGNHRNPLSIPNQFIPSMPQEFALTVVLQCSADLADYSIHPVSAMFARIWYS